MNQTGAPITGIFNKDTGEILGIIQLGAQTPTAVGNEKGTFSRAGTVHARRAIAAARVLYEDSASTAFTENWADKTTNGWVEPATPGTQVSAGKLYSTGTGGGASAAAKSFALTGSQTLRAVFSVSTAAVGASGGVIVGVSKDTAGGTPSNGGTNSFGLYFRANNAVVQSMDNGTATDITGSSYVASSTYLVTVTVDSLYISVVAYNAATGDVIRARKTRAAFGNVNNLFLFNSDTRALTGMSIGQSSGRKAIASLPANETAQSYIYSGDGTNDWQLTLPAGYDSRKPLPLCVAFHGNGSDENHWSSNANGKVVKDAMVAAGYAFLGVNYAANKSTWGAQNSLNAYVAAYNWVRAFLPLDCTVIYANSMGGIESLLTLAERRIPGVLAWVGTSPTTNLADNYTNAFAVANGFPALINTAYGITGTAPNDYATATAGHDPMTKSPSDFRAIPMLFLAASDDVAVSKATNTDVMVTALAAYTPVTSVAGIVGGHSFSFGPYTAQITAFFDAARFL